LPTRATDLQWLFWPLFLTWLWSGWGWYGRYSY
jgi:hypothetical protein